VGAEVRLRMSAPRVAVVDDQNRFVRWTERAEIHALRLPHRSTQVLLFDSQQRLVLQKRSAHKATYAGYWDASSSGHVEEPDYADASKPDEDLDGLYARVAHRELEEELGVVASLERLDAFAPEAGVHYEHFVLFRGVHDGPYRPQASEVEEVRAFSAAEYDALEASGAPITRSLKWLVRWARNRGLF
jgi:isopentenyldiphosphate isomerase